jgi:hypothetical protein
MNKPLIISELSIIGQVTNIFFFCRLVSFGDGCARDFPGVYSKISEPMTLKWIEKKISSTKSNVCRNPEVSLMRSIFGI